MPRVLALITGLFVLPVLVVHWFLSPFVSSIIQYYQLLSRVSLAFLRFILEITRLPYGRLCFQ